MRLKQTKPLYDFHIVIDTDNLTVHEVTVHDDGQVIQTYAPSGKQALMTDQIRKLAGILAKEWGFLVRKVSEGYK